MGFEIRSAVPQDAETLFSLIRELAVYEKIEDQLATDADGLRFSLFERREAEALIVQSDGVAVGYAIFFHNYSTFKGRTGLYLEDIYIQPAYRGKGYGTAVFDHLIQLAKERGCPRMEWTCLNWNAPSIKFYKSLGAKPLDEWTLFRLQL